MELHVAITPENPLYFIGWGVILFMIFVPIFVGNNTSIRSRSNFEKGWAVLLTVSYAAMTVSVFFVGRLHGLQAYFAICVVFQDFWLLAIYLHARDGWERW